MPTSASLVLALALILAPAHVPLAAPDGAHSAAMVAADDGSHPELSLCKIFPKLCRS